MNQKENITLAELDKVDIRICKILNATRVEGTDKLIKIVLDTGIDEREALTNIGSQFEPEELIGKSFPFVLNLEPIKIRGIESGSMILASKDGNGVNLLFSNADTGSVVI